MTTETIFTSYEPIEQYLKLVEMAQQRVFESAITIKAIDTFLMKQIAFYYPVAPTIVDFAAASTLGASTIFWLAHPGIQQVVVPLSRGDDDDWLRWVQGAQKSMGLKSDPLILPLDDIDFLSRWDAIQSHLNPLSPPIFGLAVSDAKALEMRVSIETLLSQVAEPLIFLLPIGPIGQSSVLDMAQSICTPNMPYQLTVTRELNFFFATSQLGLIYKKENHLIPDILSRIQHLYEGNFDVLSLLEKSIDWQVANQSEKVAQVQQDMPILIAPPYPEPLLSGRLIQRGYQALVPSGLQFTLWNWSRSMFAGLIRYYHKTVPLQTRIALRDIRVLLIGR